jgi:hypothetical protein
MIQRHRSDSEINTLEKFNGSFQGKINLLIDKDGDFCGNLVENKI